MKLLIVGSRTINEFDLSPYVPSETELIISGGAYGIDSVAEQYADRFKISKLIMRPKYQEYGRIAPLERNKRMVHIADAVLAIWDGVSSGTRYTIEYARAQNKPVNVVRVGMKNNLLWKM